MFMWIQNLEYQLLKIASSKLLNIFFFNDYPSYSQLACCDFKSARRMRVLEYPRIP